MYSSQGLQEVPVFDGDLSIVVSESMNNSHHQQQQPNTQQNTSSCMLPEFNEYSLFEDCLDTKSGNLDAFDVSEIVKVEQRETSNNINNINNNNIINNNNNNIVVQQQPHSPPQQQQQYFSSDNASCQYASTSPINQQPPQLQPITSQHQQRHMNAGQQQQQHNQQQQQQQQQQFQQQQQQQVMQNNTSSSLFPATSQHRSQPPAYPFSTSPVYHQNAAAQSPVTSPVYPMTSVAQPPVTSSVYHQTSALPAVTSPVSPYGHAAAMPQTLHVDAVSAAPSPSVTYNNSPASPYNSPMGSPMHQMRSAQEEFMPLRQALFNRHATSMNAAGYPASAADTPPPPPYGMQFGQMYEQNMFDGPTHPGAGGKRRKHDYELTPDEYEKRRLRRERNKLAALRCRQRRRERIEELERETTKIETENSSQRTEIQTLKTQVSELMQLLKQHDCSKALVNGENSISDRTLKNIVGVKNEN